MRNLTDDFTADIEKQDIVTPLLYLLELSYSGTTLYFVNNHQNVISNTKTYRAFPFGFTLPPDTATQGSATLTIDNVDRGMAEFILSAPVNTDIEVAVHILDESRMSATATTGIEMSYQFLLKNVKLKRNSIQGELKYYTYLFDSFPKLRKTPNNFPGIF